MGNCLITKLKGTVSNPELVKFGQTILKVHNIDADNMYLVLDLGSASWTDTIVTGDNITIQPNHTVKLGISATDYEVRITNKYMIKGIYVTNSSAATSEFNQNANHHVSFKYWDDALYNGKSNEPKFRIAIHPDSDGDVKNLKGYSDIAMPSSMTDGYIVPLKGDIADMVSDNLTGVVLQNSAKNLYGNISAFASCPLLNQLKISADLNWISGGSAVTGDIASLVPCTNLKFDVTFGGTKVYGRLEDLVSGQAASRTSGGFSILIDNTSITFNEVPRTGLRWLKVNFTATGAQIVNRVTPTTIYAEYNKTTGVWTYQNLN